MMQEVKENIDVKDPEEEALPPLKKLSGEEFMNLVRFGGAIHLRHVLDKDPELVNLKDVHGNSCLHWAARRGDLDVFSLLTALNPENLLERSANETEMAPIHWACSQGHFPIVRHIVEQNRNSLDIVDHSACTPLIIATQYNFMSIMAYLVNEKCDLFAKDSNGDTALHWAAYKGYDQAVELLMFFMPQCLENEDNFGQTPLHLAAMKGHVAVVKTLIGKYQASTRKRDKSGYTALDHSMQKGLLYMEITIRQLSSGSALEVWRGLGWRKVCDGRALGALVVGMNVREQGCWMWRVIFLSNFCATYTVLNYAMSVALADCLYLHTINTMLHCVWWISFLMCLFKEPGFVSEADTDSTGGDGEGKTPLLTYGDYLAQGHGFEDAKENPQQRNNQAVQLCHTCKVRRPLRAKHCKIQEKCVLKFDHFCPYVYNTIGRDNYKYFFSLLLVHPIAYVTFLVTTYTYISRTGDYSIAFILFMAYSGLMLLLMLGLLSYHTRLVTRDLTTNEDVNVHKYGYLWNEYNDYSNPFRHMRLLESIMEVYFPDNTYYYTRQDVIKARQAQR